MGYSIPAFELRPYLDVVDLAKTRTMPLTGQPYSFDMTPYYEAPCRYLSDVAKTCRVVISAPSQTGKQLDGNTLIPTPDGLKPLRDLMVGDLVYSMDGTATSILWKSCPQYRPMYRVTFDDGTYLDAGDEHKWLASESDMNQHRKPEVVYTTQQMYDEMERRRHLKAFVSRGKLRSVYAIRMPDPIIGTTKELPIDPYTLGAWLGDGQTSGSRIYKSAEDLAEMFPFCPAYQNGSMRCPCVTPDGLWRALRINGLFGNKHIPEAYFSASREQRLALLQGLMDTGGTVDSRGGRVEFVQKSERLTDDVLRLIATFGIKTHHRTILKRIKASGFEGTYHRIAFTTDLPVFRLSRKASRMRPTMRRDSHWRYIRSIEPIPTVESFCIAVDHPSHTFLAGEQYCVTHNSELMLNFIAHIAIYDPSPSLLVMDTSRNSEQFSSGRVRPLLRDFVKLTAFDDTTVMNRNDDKKKAVREYSLANSSPLYIGGSVSLSDLCSKPCKYLVLDELARFYEGKEGSSVDLALKRQMRFRGMALLTSTPTLADNYITQYWRSGTAQTWGVICPDCGEWFTCVFDKIIYDDVTEPCYACPHCGCVHSESEIVAAKHCYCEPTNDKPYQDRFHRISRSFEITGEMCHAFFTWAQLRTEYNTAVMQSEGSVQAFWNTTLARVWVPREDDLLTGDAFGNPDVLHDYDDQSLPEWVVRLTAGGDTQDDSLYIQVLGFNADGTKVCAVYYRVFAGDTAQGDVWREYSEFVTNYTAKTVDGRSLKISLCLLDAGGHRQNQVLTLTLANPRIRAVRGRFYATEGKRHETALVDRVSSANALIGSTRVKCMLVYCGTICAKDLIYTRLRRLLYSESPQQEGTWFPTTPMCGHDDGYYKGLMSNRRVDVADGHKYVLMSGCRDEALDTFGYAMCAQSLLMMCGGQTPTAQILKEAIKKQEGEDAAKRIIDEADSVPETAVTPDGFGMPTPDADLVKQTKNLFRRKFKKF